MSSEVLRETLKRLRSSFAYLRDRHRGGQGLNLTRATLDATLKYPWFRSDDPRAFKDGNPKWNIYPDDMKMAQWVRADEALEPGGRLSFEAQVMDWCDDVAYACHDMEDFYRAGQIPLHALFAFAPARQGSDSRKSLPLEARTFF